MSNPRSTLDVIRTFTSAAALLAACAGSSAGIVTVNFHGLPGLDAIPGTADDVPYTGNDFYSAGQHTARSMSDEYASVGLHISGTAAAPTLWASLVGLDPDGTPGNPTANTVLLGQSASLSPQTPIVLHFDLDQSSVTVDVNGTYGGSGTSVPVVLRHNGIQVAAYSLTSANALINLGPAGHPNGRWVIQQGVTFNEIQFGLTVPGNDGVSLDNITFEGTTNEALLNASLTAQLTASDAAAADHLGHSCSLSGDTAIVGAWSDDNAAGTDAGAAYVFTRSGGWPQQAKLVASDGAAGDRFGWDVAISGDTAVVGALLDDNAGGTDAGAAYVFTRSGTVWTQQAKLLPSDGAAGNNFGASVAILGSNVLVGAPGNTNAHGQAAGAVYVFTRSGTVWTQQVKLTASDGAAFDGLGAHVSFTSLGPHLIALAGAPAANNETGAAYVFTINTIAPNPAWGQTAKLTAPDGADFHEFGCSVSGFGSEAIIGSSGTTNELGDPNYAGAAYVFTSNASAGGWTLQAELTASDGQGQDLFGSSVSISGLTAIVGATLKDGVLADTGSAYIFRRSGVSWSQRKRIPAGAIVAGSRFGESVALDADTALVGGSYFDGPATDAGTVLVYDISTLGITTQPVSNIACTNSAASLSIAAAGTDSITYRWLRGAQILGNTGNISGALTNTLTLSPAGPADSGDYVCQVFNAAGEEASTPATLTVRPGGYANCDNSTTAPALNVADFTCFLQRYAANDAYANCDASTTAPTLNVADFTCYLQKYAAGCP